MTRAEQVVVSVARLYYEHGMTHQQIAEELGLSRVKVTRLLAEARAQGVVEIRINGADDPFADLSDRLASAFDLERVWIAPSGATPAASRLSVAKLGASCLNHHLAEARVVAVGLSSTLGEAVAQLSGPGRAGEQPSLAFVPMAGSWGGWQRGLNPGELATRLAERLNGRAHGFPAPLLAPSAEFAAALAGLPEVSQALTQAASADTVVFGVGGLDWSTSPLQDSLTEDERHALVGAGAVGDVAARFFDSDGHAVDTSVDRRAIGMSLADLVRAPRRILLAHGRRKVEALGCALRARMATILCTDSDTARALLDEP